MNWFNNLFPANRVAALVAFAGSVATAASTAAGSWGDDRVVKATGIAVGVLGAVVTVVKFLSGSQAWESYIADPAKDVDAAGQAGNVFHPGDDPFAVPTDDPDPIKPPA